MIDFFYLIILIIIAEVVFDMLVDILNLGNISSELPKEFEGYYDSKEYLRSQEYLKTTTTFGIVKSLVVTSLTVLFLSLSGLAALDQWVRSVTPNTYYQAFLFFASLGVLGWIVGLPFTIFSTFKIEERFGFNRTTLRTFVMDQFKGMILSAILGTVLLAGAIWFFESFGDLAWFWAWVGLIIFQIFILFVAPVVLMPLFNKFEPLPEGELKTAIEEYARKENFQMQGVFTMDGSKRSTKANAFFTGFGRFRRIVLFDTLIKQQTIPEIVAVLAHEVGHFKRKHIPFYILRSFLSSGIMLFLLSYFLNHPNLFKAFDMHPSIYGGFILFSFLYSPLSQVFSIVNLAISRKNEFEADEYSARTYGNPLALMEALKKLSVQNLANLTPHPWKVFWEYSHPPLLQRINHLKRFSL